MNTKDAAMKAVGKKIVEMEADHDSTTDVQG
jgi:hypothetical protein